MKRLLTLHSSRFLAPFCLLALLAASHQAVAQQGMRVGSNAVPSEMLHVEGAILLGTTSNTNAGTIRWNGTDFQGYNGSAWVSLNSAGALYTAGTGLNLTGNAFSLVPHTGDVTGTTALTIANNAVTVAKLPAGATGTTFLRGDGTWALPTGTTYSAGTGLTLSGTTFSHTAHTGDVTGADALTITNNAVTNTKLADMAASTIKGRITSAGDPQDLTATQVRTLLNVADGATANAGTVTSVAALTLGTTGTDLSSSVANSTSTPVITLNVPTASASNRGALSAADWSTFNSKENALTFSTGLTRNVNTITNNLSTGVAGGQTAIGGTAAGNSLTLSSTTNATKGKILFGNSAYDEVNNRLGLGNTAPDYQFDVKGLGIDAGPGTFDNILGRFEQSDPARGAGIQIKGYRNTSGNITSFVDLRNQSTTNYSVARMAALREAGEAGSLLIYTNSGTALTERVRINSAGVVQLNAYTTNGIVRATGGNGTLSTAGGAVNLASEVTGVLPVANGGTGSATQNFVDLTTAQTAAGTKTWTGTGIFSNGTNAALFSSGNVGINNANPSKLLEIGNNLNTAPNVGSLRITGSNGAPGAWKQWSFEVGSTSTGTSIYNTERLRISAGVTEMITVDGTGNVGIGETSPSQKLDVNGNTTTNGLQVGTGTMFTNMQGGKADVGSSGGEVLTHTVTFPTAFSGVPTVICTASTEPGQNYDDSFNVTIRNVSATGFVMIINRVDGSTWGQNLDVNWFAFR